MENDDQFQQHEFRWIDEMFDEVFHEASKTFVDVRIEKFAHLCGGQEEKRWPRVFDQSALIVVGQIFERRHDQQPADRFPKNARRRFGQRLLAVRQVQRRIQRAEKNRLEEEIFCLRHYLFIGVGATRLITANG